jgi:hypothetical protein
MGELVLLVIAAAWAAVLIPPLLRNRIENRPNSSVTDFRRQLNKLQSTVPSRAGAPMRGMARPLAQSPLQRPAAAGRPGMQQAQLRRGAGGRTHGNRSQQSVVREREQAPRRRAHGDTTGGQRRPQHRDEPRRHGDPTGGQRRPQYRDEPRRHGDPTGGQRRPQYRDDQRPAASTDLIRRRRSNVLFMLVVAVASTLFLAATTQEPAMLYVFAAAFLGLCGYAFMLSQARQRESTSWPSDWMHHR